MNIVIGEKNAAQFRDKYTLLSLDTFSLENIVEPVKSYCVIENIPINEISQINSFIDLHEKLMINYDLRNWSFCEQAIEHLMGKWNNELDTFYINLSQRIQTLKTKPLDTDWSPIIKR